MKNQTKILAVLTAFMLLFSGCSGALSTGNDSAQSESGSGSSGLSGITETAVDTSGMFTDRDSDASYDESTSVAIKLNGSSAECESSAVEISGSTVKITDEGTYILTGSLTDGMIVVEAEKTDKIQLVLKGAEITSASSAAIYVLQADKVFITLAEGTENTLANGGVFTAIDDNNIDAAIFSKDDLTINGSGSLKISSPAGHGIVSKDDLAITGGSFEITAASHGLSGKDCVKIAGGSFNITSGKDGVHAENADDATLGYLYIAGGSFNIDSEGDGISASEYLLIEGGSYNIVSGGGSASVTKSSGGDWNWGGMQEDSSDTASVKGIKAEGKLTINGGAFSIDSADDGLHSNSDLTVTGGSFEIATGDNGLHSDGTTSVTGGTINISKSYEGIEGVTVNISGGTIDLVASDDGINAAGGNDQSGFGGFGGFSGNESNTDTSSHVETVVLMSKVEGK